MTNKQEKDWEPKEELEHKVGLMRQWLNENRIDDVKKFVTNEDLMKWL